MQERYCLPLSLYTQLKQSLRYKSTKNIDDMIAFIDDLSGQLKVETAILIHEETWNSILVFKDQSNEFLAWICPKLRPMLVLEKTEIYRENDKAEYICFLVEG